MCVIMLTEKTRPTEDMVRRMYTSNSSGAGIAYRGTKRGKPVVQWQKGLNKEEIVELCATVPLPFVAHFRIPTCGGARPSLCHPFPIEKDVSLDLKGETPGYVLFHNGHWARWKDSMMEAIARQGFQMPSGKWSDTRGMAWWAAHFGVYTLDLIDEKAVAFGPTDLEIFGSPWMMASEIKDIWVSNKGWEGGSYMHGRGTFSSVCWAPKCTEEKYQSYNYCVDHLEKDSAFKGNVKDITDKLVIDTSCSVDDDDDAKRAARGTSAKDPFRDTRTPTTTGKTLEEAVSQGSQKVTGPHRSGTDTLTPLTPEQRALAWAKRFNPHVIHSATVIH